MKNQILATAALASVVLAASANGLTMRDRMYLRSLPMMQKAAADLGEEATGKERVRALAAASTQRVLAVARVADEDALAELEDQGVDVRRCRGGFAVLNMPIDMAEGVAAHRSLKSMSISRPVAQKMDKARAISGIDKIHSGLDLPQAYTGQGVICGIVDGGIDPNHANFRFADGSSRISTMSQYVYNTTYGQIYSYYYNPSNIGAFTTDDATNYHGTHTTGIMAGGYMGDTYVAVENKITNTTYNQTISNPFYGVAYNADLAIGIGSEYDGLIFYNIEDILDYTDWANEYKTTNTGQDCIGRSVINLSLGTCYGPHDGSTEICEYFDYVTENDNAIIVLAAGNEGDMKIALNKTLASDDDVLQTFLYPGEYYAGTISQSDGSTVSNWRMGTVEMYSDTDQDFELSLIAYNKQRGRVAWTKTLPGNSEGAFYYYVSSDDWAYYDDDIVDLSFGRYFEGYIGFGSMLDEESGRYYAAIDCYLIDNETMNEDGNYVLGFKVTGKQGQRIDCFNDGYYMEMSDYGIEGYDDGMYNGSISDMACSKNVIVVGSYNTREYFPSLEGNMYYYGDGVFPEGEVTSFSSFGTLVDGRNLPHIVAPGAMVVSSVSEYYRKYYSMEDINFSGYAVANDRYSYYYQTVGTSMAAPVVAGTIALWLEANPELTAQEARELLMETATTDEYTAMVDPVKVGAGKLNAYEGLKKMLESNSIKNVKLDESRVIITAAGDRAFDIYVNGASSINAELYNIAGQRLRSYSANGSELCADLSGIANGVYILNVNNQYSQRILVK